MFKIKFTNNGRSTMIADDKENDDGERDSDGEDITKSSIPNSKAVVKNIGRKAKMTTMTSKLWQTFIYFMAPSRVYECGSKLNSETKQDLCLQVYCELFRVFVEKRSSEKRNMEAS